MSALRGIRPEDAAARLATYCDSKNGYAWPLYDEDPSPTVLSGADITAPALLSYPIPGTLLNEMGRNNTSYRHLVEALAAFVAIPIASSFAELDRQLIERLAQRRRGDRVEGPADWAAFVRCLDIVQECKGLTTVAVTKILHRKRPGLVPINDSRVRSRYGTGPSYPALFTAIHRDLQDSRIATVLDEARAPYATPAGTPMSLLRALDIITWMGDDAA